MKHVYNEVGLWCRQTCKICGEYGLCEHNQADASILPAFVCTGIGGSCNKGSKWHCGTSSEKGLQYHPEYRGFQK